MDMKKEKQPVNVSESPYAKFCEETPMSGFLYARNAGNVFLKGLWILILIGCFLGGTIFVCRSLLEYITAKANTRILDLPNTKDLPLITPNAVFCIENRNSNYDKNCSAIFRNCSVANINLDCCTQVLWSEWVGRGNCFRLNLPNNVDKPIDHEAIRVSLGKAVTDVPPRSLVTFYALETNQLFYGLQSSDFDVVLTEQKITDVYFRTTHYEGMTLREGGTCDEKNLTFYPSYTYRSCKWDCWFQASKKFEGCATSDFGSPNQTPIPAQDFCNDTNKIDKFDVDAKNKMAESCINQCAPSCNRWSYERIFMETVQPISNGGTHEVAVHLSIPGRYSLVQETPSVTLPSLIADIGGTVGIYLGLHLAGILFYGLLSSHL